MTFQSFIDAALLAINEVSLALKTHSREELTTPHAMGHGGDVSIGADLISESILVRHLSPFGRIFSEESGYIGEGLYEIVIDPIDGSDNFKHAVPYFGIAIALTDKNVTHVGIVCNLVSGEIFVRSDGEVRICQLHSHCSCTSLTCKENPTVGLFEKAYANHDVVRDLARIGLKFRAPGAVALSLAYAHYVKYVLFLGTIRHYDIAAGWHLCDGLWRYRDESRLLIARDETTFAQLCSILNIDPKDRL